MKNTTAISIIFVATLIVVAIMFSKGVPNSSITNNKDKTETNISASNVSIVDGKQIIEIQVKGGYSPQKSLAKSGVPTILRLKTNGTFDCSSSVQIPSLGVRKLLPQSGSIDIDLGVQKDGALQGTCGMGMYRFELDFQS
ncbi:MAG: cupredoxin domain-containing protein [Candidatus Paceibacterota bacterium]